MVRLNIIIFLILILLFPTNLTSHVSHYSKIKLLKYDLFLNNELIGYHNLNFNQKKGLLEVSGTGSFSVSKFGVNLMEYNTKTKGIYRGNQLIKFNSKTKQNKKDKYVNIELKENSLIVNGSSFKGKTQKDTMVSSWWNHEIVSKKNQISSISGRLIDQKVKFLGKKKIIIDNKSFETLNFHIFSDDEKPMNEKKLNIKLWYDIKNLIWIKASYEKFGLWEYRISQIN